MGEFEFAKVCYHRGLQLRPEIQEFRVGIQKAQEAMENAVGCKSIYSSCHAEDFITSIFIIFNCPGPPSVKLEKKGDLKFFQKDEEVSQYFIQYSVITEILTIGIEASSPLSLLNAA